MRCCAAQESDKEHKADLKRQARLLSEANAEVEQWKAESDDWRMEATQLLVQVKVATQEPRSGCPCHAAFLSTADNAGHFH